MWPVVAAIAVPLIVDALTPDPKKPKYPTYGLPNRDAYFADLYHLAHDPQSDVYRLASDQALDQVNRALAQRGIGNSSAAFQTISASQNDLANRFLENEFNRRQSAINAMTNYDIQKGNLAIGQAGNQYNADYNQYQADVKDRDRLIAGVGTVARTGAAMYGANLAGRERDDYRNALRSMYGMNVAAGEAPPTYGVPGYPGYRPYSPLGINYDYYGD